MKTGAKRNAWQTFVDDLTALRESAKKAFFEHTTPPYQKPSILNWWKYRKAFLDDVLKKYPRQYIQKFAAFHVLSESTPEQDDSPWHDFPGEESVENFLTTTLTAHAPKACAPSRNPSFLTSPRHSNTSRHCPGLPRRSCKTTKTGGAKTKTPRPSCPPSTKKPPSPFLP